MQSYIIGIDIGTGSVKAVALDYHGNAIGSSQYYYHNLETVQGQSEQDPEIIWQGFASCIKEVIISLKQVPDAVSLSSAMHSLVIVDRDHKPVTNLITWADTRSEDVAAKLRNSDIAEALYRETGTPIHSMSPLCKIQWFKKYDSQTFDKAFKFISIKEFIWFRLFKEYEIDKSIASATGLYNILSGTWNKKSLELCAIEENHLSKIVSTNFTRDNADAEIVKELGVSANTIFCIGASDGCLANIGSYALEKGTAAITIGTSGAVRVASHSPVINFKAMIFNYVLDEQTFICGGPVNNGGNVLNWMIKSFLNIQDPQVKDYDNFFEETAKTPAGSAGLLFLPYLFGERAPIWDEQSAGVFFGIKSYHDQSHFLRASLEGVCYILKNILQIIEYTTGAIVQLNVSGGFIQSRLWIQILSDITGKKIALVQTDDASAIGAALLYMKSADIIEEYTSLQHAQSRMIEPIAENHLAYEKYFPIFKNLYAVLKDSMHRIDDLNK
ncbi:MAG: gluconokinase [Ginsengibacter sp.]